MPNYGIIMVIEYLCKQIKSLNNEKNSSFSWT